MGWWRTWAQKMVCQGWTPSSATNELCNLVQVTWPFCTSVSSTIKGDDRDNYLIAVNELPYIKYIEYAH